MHSIVDAPKEEPRKEVVEPAARKVEVDEDYDNNSEDDKRAGTGQKASPNESLKSAKQEPQSAH